jgi:hypothetical protein
VPTVWLLSFAPLNRTAPGRPCSVTDSNIRVPVTVPVPCAPVSAVGPRGGVGGESAPDRSTVAPARAMSATSTTTRIPPNVRRRRRRALASAKRSWGSSGAVRVGGSWMNVTARNPICRR